MQSFILIFIIVSLIIIESSGNTLKLLHIVVRHGDRYPDVFPDSIRIDTSFREGQLTEVGKENCFLLGRWLQKRYGKFLGPYSTDLVETANTYFNRTQTSLKLVLEGLFADQTVLNSRIVKGKANKFLFRNLPLNNTLFVALNDECVNYRSYYENFQNSIPYKDILKKYENINGYLKKNMNKTFTTLTEYMVLYDKLYIQKETGVKLPYWDEEIIPMLESSVLDFFQTTVATEQLRRTVIGGFFKNFIEICTLKFENRLVPENRKLFLYSGHDLNVFWTLHVFNYMFKSRPQYASCVMIEVHTIENVNGFKVFYKDGSKNQAVAVAIPGCGYFCPLTTFIDLYDEYLLTYDTC